MLKEIAKWQGNSPDTFTCDSEGRLADPLPEFFQFFQLSRNAKYSDCLGPEQAGLLQHVDALMLMLSPSEMQEVQRQITDLLSKQLIAPSPSPFEAPILFVKKKTGDLRMVVDYTALNKMTTELPYLGHINGEDGIKPDPKKALA
ncbi:hypothetical protein WJX82_000537 [Trebouxia sp. C0006]